jgi:uncharacterized protein YdbL (DUF1318 family)
MNKLLNKVLLALIAGSMLVSVAAAADLSTAKSQGWIGEQANGYLGLVRSGAPADIRALVADVNKKRKARYQQTANKHGTALREVEKVGGKTTIAKTAPGNFIKDASGRWRKK